MKIVNNQLEEIKDSKTEIIINEVHNAVIKYLKEHCEGMVIENQLNNKKENLVVEIVLSTLEKCTMLYNGKK